MSEVKYYLIAGRSNVARDVDSVYSYLNHETGEWVHDPSLIDDILFEAGTVELSLAKARKWVEKAVPTIEPIWIDGIDS